MMNNQSYNTMNQQPEDAELNNLTEDLEQCWQAYTRCRDAAYALEKRNELSPEVIRTMKEAANQQFKDHVYDVLQKYSSEEPVLEEEELIEEKIEEEKQRKKKKGKRLYRSTDDRMIGGVCGGLAEYFDIDSTIVRVIFLVSCIFYLIGGIAYVAMLFIVPQREDT